MEYIIITRHPAAIEFVRKQFPDIECDVLPSATNKDVAGKIVIGNLPLHLACHAREVWSIEFDGPPPRGEELTLEDMEKNGAKIEVYKVISKRILQERFSDISVDEIIDDAYEHLLKCGKEIIMSSVVDRLMSNRVTEETMVSSETTDDDPSGQWVRYDSKLIKF